MGFRLAIILFFFALPAFAGVEQISEKEFRALAEELSSKVNLFAETWKQNPEAEFYGGTTRDYFYWLKGQFQEAHTKSQAQTVIEKLRAMPAIDVREFIIGDSDVDIISKSGVSLNAENFGVRKIDWQPVDILDPNSEAGKNEILQGYIPAEKIRLSQKGVQATQLGNGLKEIYDGKLTVHFASPEDFAKSKYAKDGINHPVLLALRYLRLQAINYYRTHGKGYPNKEKLFAGMDEASRKAVREVIEGALKPGVLKAYLARDQFRSWFNGGIQKSFRSYTNPTAALELMKEFRVMLFPDLYPKKVEPLNQYVFTQFRDEEAIATIMRKFNVDETKLFTPVKAFFPDGKFYHGTKNEVAFRGILFQGVLPSDGGSGGAGLYGVAEKNKKFSETWGGAKDRLLSFEIEADARIVDITKGYGKKVFQLTKALHGGSEDEFARLFGVDIVRYEYETEAFVVKNAAALGKAQGVYRTVAPFSDILEKAPTLKDPLDVVRLISMNSLSASEKRIVWDSSPIQAKDIAALLRRKSIPEYARKFILDESHWWDAPEVEAELYNWLFDSSEKKRDAAYYRLTNERNGPLTPSRLEALNKVFASPKWEMQGLQRQSLMRRFSVEGIFTQESIEAALRWLESSVPEDRINIDFVNHLDRSELSSAQLERIHKLYAAKSRYRTHFGPILLRNGSHVEKTKADFFAAFHANRKRFDPTDKYSVSLSAGELRVLAEFFPEDEKVRAAVREFIDDAIQISLTHGLSFGDVYELLAHVTPVMNEELVGKMLSALEKSDKKENYLYSLMRLDLNDEALAKVFAHIPLNSSTGEAVLEVILPKNRGKMGPKSLLALTRLYLSTDDSRGGNRKLIMDAIRDNHLGKENELRKYLGEILDSPDLFRGENGQRHNKIKEGSKVFEILSEGGVPFDEDLTEKSLSFLERHNALKPGSTKGSHTTAIFLASLPLEQREISQRVQALVAQDSIYIGEPQAMAALVDKIPEMTEDFRDYVLKFVANGEDAATRWGDSKAKLPQYLALKEKILPAAECPAGFAALSSGNP